MAPRTKATLRRAGSATVIEIEGDLDSQSEPVVKPAFEQALDTGARRVLLAFREEDAVTSAGIALLINLLSDTRERGVALRIAHPSEHYRRLIDVMGLTRHVEVHASAAAALEAWDSPEDGTEEPR